MHLYLWEIRNPNIAVKRMFKKKGKILKEPVGKYLNSKEMTPQSMCCREARSGAHTSSTTMTFLVEMTASGRNK